MQVREIMTNKAEWVGPDTCLEDIAVRMRDLNIGSLPVGENDRLIGMVTDRDICCRGVADGKDPAKTTAREVMSKGVSYCFDDQDVTEAAHLMEDKKIRRLPVLDRGKRMVGLLSLDDISLGASRALTSEVMEAVAVKH